MLVQRRERRSSRINKLTSEVQVTETGMGD